MSDVAIVAIEADARAAHLASQLQLPLFSTVDELPEVATAYLSYHDGALKLFPRDKKQSGPVAVDFNSEAANYRLRSGGELIVKAVKGRSKNALRVVDATAGLGRDAFILAANGFHVLMLEKNPFVAALLSDGLARAREAQHADIANRMQLVAGAAETYLANCSGAELPDVIYLDPMFAHAEKSALVKKEMRLFRQLLNDENGDETALLATARAHAKLRVVVKRAIKAPALAQAEPSYALTGKAVRYDVYTC